MPVRPSHRGRGDVVTGLDVGKAALYDAGDGEIRGHGDGHHLPCLGPDDQALPLDPINRAADAGRGPSAVWASAGRTATGANSPVKDDLMDALRMQ